MDTFWGKIMAQGSELLMHGKVVRIVILGMIGVMVYAYSWANGQFVERDDFNELDKTVRTHIDDMRIVSASQYIRDKELSLQLQIATNADSKNIAHLEHEIQMGKQYRDCLIGELPNCKHLKPQD